MEQFGRLTFEWDDAKRESNLRKHGLDFLRMRQLFDERPVVTRRSSYVHEERYLTTGIVGDRFVTLVWTLGNGATRFISAKRACDGETRAYRALHG